MDEYRTSRGHILALAGSIVSLIALWMPWYDAVNLPHSLREPELQLNAWQVFGGADVLIAIAAVSIAAVLLAGRRIHHDIASQVAAWGGAAMALEVVWKLLNPPVMSEYASPVAGAWVALIAAVAICAGGCGAAAASSSELRRSRAGARRLRAGYR